MSRTKPVERGVENPVRKIISYKPNSGEFAVYDRVSKSRETLDEISVIILDATRNSISGFSPQYDSGILCNTVTNTKKEPLTLGVIKDGKYSEVKKGLYQDIKDFEGAKYTRNVFCLLADGDDYVVSDLQLTGMARSQFDDWFQKNENTAEASLVTLKPSEKVYNYVKKTGELEVVPKDKQKRWRTTWLKVLTPDLEKLGSAENDMADEMDTKLQDYFSGSSQQSSTTNVPEPEAQPEEVSDDLPF